MIPVIPTEAVAGGLQLAFGFIAAVVAFLQYIFLTRG